MKIYGVLLGIILISGCASAPKNPPVPEATVPKASDKPTIKSFPDQPQFVVECRFEGRPFSIHFQSKSGKLENHDMSVSLVVENTEVPINISPGWYHAVDSTGSFPSYCDGVPALAIEGTQQFLLVFNLDQRIDKKPSFPETTLVLIDLKSKRVLNRLERIGKLKSHEVAHYTIIPAQNGFQVRLIRDPIKDVEGWKWIIVRKGSMTTKWMSSGKKSEAY